MVVVIYTGAQFKWRASICNLTAVQSPRNSNGAPMYIDQRIRRPRFRATKTRAGTRCRYYQAVTCRHAPWRNHADKK